MKSRVHIPILVQEILDGVLPAFEAADEPATFIDCTFGGGGHTRAFLDAFAGHPKLAQHRILALDQDPAAIERGRIAFKNELASGRLELLHSRFSQVDQHLPGRNAIGLLADLGFSSLQLDENDRGLSFLNPGPIDMRLDPSQGESAESFLKRVPESELVEIFREYGEERFSGRIARHIVEARNSKSFPKDTVELAHLISNAVPSKFRHGRIHPATRCFQAIRIAVNDELGELDALLSRGILGLQPSARIAIISFHSLEDRRVKQTFKDESGIFRPLTKKPITPSDQELEHNSRSRSAKLRIAEKLQ